MIMKLAKGIRRLYRNEKGATGMEYGLFALAIGAAIMLSVKATGLQVKCLYDSVAQVVGGGGGHACT